MSEQKKSKGVYQLENGLWAYRFIIKVDGKNVIRRRTKDESGKPFKTQNQALNARSEAIAKERITSLLPPQNPIVRKTFSEIYNEYCEKGRSGKAYTTIKKQDSLWNNHIKAAFGNRYIDDLTLAEVQDYLEMLYYTDNRAYSYTESFLKFFYLILGQAYSRGYIDTQYYNNLCKNKDTKIHMPKMKIDDDTDIVYFNYRTLNSLDEYFKGTNAETAYMLGRYCGLRINECYGLKWSNIDLNAGTITIDRQMQYQEGLIKIVSLKTRNAKRKIYLCSRLKEYLQEVKRQQALAEATLSLQRQQNQTIITDLDGSPLSSLDLVNSLSNGKIQTVNSMKFHSKKIKTKLGIIFKYHYLRHTYGTNLAALNTPEYILCNQMGHASSKVTHKYYVAISQNAVSVLKENLEKI